VIPFKDNIPTDTVPWITVALILANVVVYLVAVAHGGSVISGPDQKQLVDYGAIPAVLTWDKVFTSMFIQASIVQLAGNMLFLWIFGNTIEDAMGAVRFVGFYFIGGVCAMALQAAIESNSTAPAVGAAGAIATVIGAYTVLYRRAGVITLVLIPLLFTVMEVPALVLLVLWFAMQAAFSAAGLTDWAAYAGQALAFALGALTIRLLASNRKQVPPARVL
jgi:membrane associated rhomboid family serine protease